VQEHFYKYLERPSRGMSAAAKLILRYSHAKFFSIKCEYG